MTHEESPSDSREPCIILAHAARCATLQEGAPPRLSEVQSLNRKPLQ
jgi:hypothetical protein